MTPEELLLHHVRVTCIKFNDMLLWNISDFSLIPPIRRYQPLFTRPNQRRSRQKANTKRINYLVKMISPPGHKIMFSPLPLARHGSTQGQGLSAGVCVACLSLYSVRIGFILINHYVISLELT